jgi:hypothetical protein
MRPARIACAFALAAVCAGLAGCSSNNKGKIEGTTWTCRDQLANGKPVTAGSREFEFKADGGLVMLDNGVTYTGTYSLGSGDHVTFHFDKPYEGGKKHVRTIQINGDEMDLIEPSGMTVKFKKVSGPPPKR